MLDGPSSLPSRWCWWWRTRPRSPPCCATTWKSRASASSEAADGQEALTRIAETPARPGAARLDAAGDVGHRGLPPDPPPPGHARPAGHHGDRAHRGSGRRARPQHRRRRLHHQAVQHRRAAGADARRCCAGPTRCRRRGCWRSTTSPWTCPRTASAATAGAVHLGPTEFRLLEFFMQHPRRVFSREELLDAVWGPDIHVEPRTVDVHIRRLRKAINGDRRTGRGAHRARRGLRIGYGAGLRPAGEARLGLRPRPRQGALPLTPPRGGALGTPDWECGEGKGAWGQGAGAVGRDRRHRRPAPTPPSPPHTPSHGVQRPLPLVGVQGAKPPGGVWGEAPAFLLPPARPLQSPLARIRGVCLNIAARRGDSLGQVIYPHRSGMHGPVVGRAWHTLDRTRSKACPKPSSPGSCRNRRN